MKPAPSARGLFSATGNVRRERPTLIGDEIVQFRSATLIATNRYRLAGMLRGRFGTEQHAGNHKPLPPTRVVAVLEDDQERGEDERGENPVEQRGAAQGDGDPVE